MLLLTISLFNTNNALATFADLELIRVYYDRSGAEYASDLGNVNTILGINGPQSFSGSFIGANGVPVLAAYFALDSTNKHLWASNANAVTTTFIPAIIGGPTGLTSIKSGTTFMYNTYNSTAVGNAYSGLASHSNSYKAKISATQGWFANTITAANSARTYSELDLNNLTTTNTQSLYYWANGLATTSADKAGVAVAQLTTNTDGYTTIEKLPRINGACGTSNTQQLFSAPTTDLCISGKALPVSTGNGPWSWVCNGQGIDSNGAGTNAGCATSTIYNITVKYVQDPNGNGKNNGTITCDSPVAPDGTSVCTITPDNGYVLSALTDSATGGLPADVFSSVSANKYTLNAVNANHTIEGAFAAGTGGSAPPTITWTPPAAINYGTPLSATQLSAAATDPVTPTTTVSGTFAYTKDGGIAVALTDLLSAGTYQLTATFHPTDTTAYTDNVATTVSLVVNPAPLTITATNVGKAYGQPLAFIGNEFSSIGLKNNETIGSVTLTSTGTLAQAGVVGSPYDITPSAATGGTFNAANYAITYTKGLLTISPAPLIITANSSGKTFGQSTTFGSTEFTASGLQNGETIGSVTLTSDGAAAQAGVIGSPFAIIPSAATAGTFTTTNYTITYVSGALTVSKATPALSWSKPAAIDYGTLLSGTQLNASAGGLSGTFVYSPAAAGSPLSIGSQILSVIFTPSDTANYNIAGMTVNLTVNPTVQIVGDKGYDTLLSILQSKAVKADATIQLRDAYVTSAPEALIFNTGFTVNLNGGMDANWAPTANSTTIKGRLSVLSGKVVANGITIR